MGYFSNGTEGMMYEEEYCLKCVHGANEKKCCPIWELHMIYNYDQCKNVVINKLLGTLIPRKGIVNGECKMFIRKAW